MDMNQLLHNHELAKQNASRAMRMQDRDTYFDLVGHYAKRIAQLRRTGGVPGHGWLDDGGQPVCLR